jgi:DNA invertase Pin-like site-specific DNA recombinase
MRVGYARTSTQEQVAGLEAQIRDLTEYGCTEIFKEQVSSVQKRDALEAALRFVRKGDALVVSKLDRLARSVPDLIRIVEQIEQREATLTILDLNLDTASPSGRLMMNLCGSIAQFEREIMLQRQREGISAAKARGAYKGRAPTARAKSDQVFDLHNSGTGASKIAEKLNISRASVYRILAANSGSKAAAA